MIVRNYLGISIKVHPLTTDRIYWGVSGGNNSIGGIEERAGLATLDPLTNKTTTILNNYFG